MNTHAKSARLDTMTAEELAEQILRLLERCIGHTILFSRVIAKRDGTLVNPQTRIAEMLEAWRDS